MTKNKENKDIAVKELVYSASKSDKKGYWIFEVSKLKKKSDSKISDESIVNTCTVKANDYESALAAGKKKLGIK